LGVRERTVKFHIAALMRKLGAGNRTEVVARATQDGLLTLAPHGARAGDG
jgi:DNA-binding NarL/FixJ family response regulator